MTAPATDGRGRRVVGVRTLVLVTTVAALVTWSTATAAATPAEAGDPSDHGSNDARELLRAAASAMDHPHVGQVAVVTFSEVGPRVAELDVRVGAMGELELRRPTRWLLGAPTGSWLRTVEGAVAVTPAVVGSQLDVEAVLARWEATVGSSQQLDTGPATPVHLVRREGAAIEEVVYVDRATSLPVRRETRGADGTVLRVVAYTALEPVELGGPGSVGSSVPVGDVPTIELDEVTDDGYHVPRSLDAGFELLTVGHRGEMVAARYGDGLSVLSVYQQHGRLDPSELEDATVRTIAGRDVWTWPGSEPVRLVWTSDDRTWTAVSDAPVEVIQDALASLPGDHVGHDVPSRIARGAARAWRWLAGLVGR